ncbi:transcriptional regulator NrdR [Candidatus Roizmanbacteria bacterium CG_4_10_14_0_2_um_filter_36_35]|uniref:Transcriptional repressor NrdR n=4 Tax=Candidatus Roizmaniibacteriota TaxID=1752723 RepID=A0A2M7BY78_9BACT|nr:MAG: transcriptional regulator NrdR [Candidatus Roizmanbacteria bacterium CG11_big_fil_rev_8_21_14_0_20_35_14]PIV11470.1 MAG: transcriptional regulator NrdR [Candidatus Roizmanbacteria bacterium CG03_land_8_20_14_0_80_35_26]PIZ68866.1 MAG: transcriptional regulator NrdR [Candidatus Roizmanbacteria bacterium CG_4_10_14_0_2_um_filter_36_35]PJC31093.1 MAG: transcriptional regulator NrdR [Candidatus Roizmanbacteria bacterium CG_4_9_14_0_2_um_filter_36_12]PJC79805.1 MAG: transcriptional regulator
MYCIFCKNTDTEVIETRLSEDGGAIRRRRQCPKCEKRFTTYERIEELPILVIKRDGRRERFDREKLRKGVILPCEKTTVTSEQIENLINEVEADLKQKDSTEIESREIGNLVARKLKKLDKIAYIRFAAVFKRFVDPEDFETELKKLT